MSPRAPLLLTYQCHLIVGDLYPLGYIQNMFIFRQTEGFVVMLNAGDKSTQKRDIRRAKALASDIGEVL